MVAVGPCVVMEEAEVKSAKEFPFVGLLLASIVAEGGGGIPEEKGEGAAMEEEEGGGDAGPEDAEGREGG